MRKISFFQLNEFFYYFFIGLTVTAIDWSLFWFTAYHLHLYYQIALVFSSLIATSCHYFANKIITFQCHSSKITSQLFLYCIVIATSLGLGMITMGLLVTAFHFNKMLSKMATTLLLVIPNYLMHKHITFNKKWVFQN